MAQEHIIADFSGGMNPSVAPDKLNENEFLLLQNCRLDETGGVGITGASSKQNTSSYSDGTNSAVHSIFYSNGIGALAGVGRDVFTGLTLGGLTDTLAAINTAKAKQTFAATPNRVYMDVNGIPYFVGGNVTIPIPVDWAPSGAASTVTTGPLAVNSSGTVTRGGSAPHWTTPQGVIGTASGTATAQFTSTITNISDYVRAINPNPALSTTSALQGITITASASATSGVIGGSVAFQAVLEIAGGIVGSVHSATVAINSGLQTITWGNVTDLWVAGITAAQANLSTFGVRILCVNGVGTTIPITCTLQNVQFTFTQGSGTGVVAGTGASGTLTGTYTWAITFVAENGEEGDYAVSQAVVLSAQMGTLTSIGLGDARTTSRNIYRKGNTLSSFYLVGSIADNITTTYADNQTDLAALTQGTIVAGGVAGDLPNTRLGSQQGKYPTLHYARLFWANGNQIFWSKIGNQFAYPAVNFIPVGDSKPIVGLVSKWGILVIIKTDSIWLLGGTDESTFNLTQSLSPVGSNMPFTIVPQDARILFCNSLGLFSFNGYNSVKVTPKLDLFFRGESRNGLNPLETLVASVYANFSAAVSNAEDYYLAYAETGQTTNNAMLVVNLNTGHISTRSIAAQSLTADPVTGYIYAGLSSGFVVRVDDWTATSDAFGTVPFSVATKYTDCGSRGSNLSFWSLEFFGDTGGNTITPTISYDNGAVSETLNGFLTNGLTRVERKFSAPRARQAQTCSVKLVSNAGVVNSSNSPAIKVVHLKLYYDVRAGRARTGGQNA